MQERVLDWPWPKVSWNFICGKDFWKVHRKGTKFIVRIPLGKELYSEDEIVKKEENAMVSQLTLSTEKSWIQSCQVKSLRRKKHSWERWFKPHILIVEDNDSIRQMLAGLFGECMKWRLLSMGRCTGKGGRRSSPHIMLSDVLMPRMSGIELVKQLKGNRMHLSHTSLYCWLPVMEIEQNWKDWKLEQMIISRNLLILVCWCSVVIIWWITVLSCRSISPTTQ